MPAMFDSVKHPQHLGQSVQGTPPHLGNLLPGESSETKLNLNFSGKIYFYCVSVESAEKAAYQHQFIVLAEGLKSLGIPFFSNKNYWQISSQTDEYLFGHDPEITPEDCSIVILDHEWFEFQDDFPENFFSSKRQYVTVYIDASDGIVTRSWEPEFRHFDFIFKSHYNSKCLYPANFYPGTFGISNRILQATEPSDSFHQRKRKLLVNFRIGHTVRESIRQKLFPVIQNVLPIDESVESLGTPPDNNHYLYWVQTGRRHHPNYYERLKNSAACASFGGYFIPAWPSDPVVITSPIGRITNKIANKLEWVPKRIMQWDSWRLWESLAAGCVTFHVDFEKYGLYPPVMPENWRHYVGIDLNKIQEAVERIAAEPQLLENISLQARRWAIEHYSPVPTALRFLATVCK